MKQIKRAEKQNSMKCVELTSTDWKFPPITCDITGLVCESCKTSQSKEWVAWGPQTHKLKLCRGCAVFWRKYGGLKTPHDLENEPWNHRNTIMSGIRFNEKLFRCVEEGCGKVFFVKYSELLRHQLIVHDAGDKILRPSPETLVKRSQMGNKKLKRAARRPFVSILPDVKEAKKLCNGT